MLLPIQLSNGKTAFVQVDASAPTDAQPVITGTGDESLLPPGTAAGRSPAKALASVQQNLDAALALVKDVATGVSDSLTKDEDRLKLGKVGLELSIGFGVEGGVFIASGKADAQLKLSLEWTLG